MDDCTKINTGCISSKKWQFQAHMINYDLTFKGAICKIWPGLEGSSSRIIEGVKGWIMGGIIVGDWTSRVPPSEHSWETNWVRTHPLRLVEASLTVEDTIHTVCEICFWVTGLKTEEGALKGLFASKHYLMAFFTPVVSLSNNVHSPCLCKEWCSLNRLIYFNGFKRFGMAILCTLIQY